MRVAILSFVLLSFLLGSNFVWASSWVEVTQFTGSGDYTTNYFTCSHAEWRINWSYIPLSDYPEYAGFTVYVYPRNETSDIARVSQDGNTTTSGTTYIHNAQGEFYLEFLVANLQGYTVVIQQDIDSIPEFSPMILLFVLATGILVATKLAHAEVERRQKKF